MRILGIDFGQKRIGLAVSDALGWTAQGITTLQNLNKNQVLEALCKVCKEHEVTEVVIGLPINMNGSLGPKALEIQVLVPELESALKIPIHTWDERLSSRAADRVMIQAGLSRKRQKESSDRVAATIILQNYLESKRKTS